LQALRSACSQANSTPGITYPRRSCAVSLAQRGRHAFPAICRGPARSPPDRRAHTPHCLALCGPYRYHMLLRPHRTEPKCRKGRTCRRPALSPRADLRALTPIVAPRTGDSSPEVHRILRSHGSRGVVVGRGNYLSRLVCMVRDCFDSKSGRPVTEAGGKSNLCFQRRRKEKQGSNSSKAHLFPAKLVRALRGTKGQTSALSTYGAKALDIDRRAPHGSCEGGQRGTTCLHRALRPLRSSASSPPASNCDVGPYSAPQVRGYRKQSLSHEPGDNPT